MKIIVGLGNPGEKYKKVRHNLGFIVVDAFVKKLDDGGWKVVVEDRSWKVEEKFKSEILRFAQNDKERLILAKPQTYMNNSGIAVKLLSTVYSLQSTDIIVVHDDLDLPFGKLKVRLGGAAAGHHGVESIINTLGTDKFIRVRLGILGGIRVLRDNNFNAEKFVLEPFMHSEKSQVNRMIKQAVSALEILLEKGLEVAQNQFN